MHYSCPMNSAIGAGLKKKLKKKKKLKRILPGGVDVKRNTQTQPKSFFHFNRKTHPLLHYEIQHLHHKK